MKDQDRVHIIADLLNKRLEGTLSTEEQVILDAWLSESEANRSLFNELTDRSTLREKLNRYSQVDSEAIWLKTQQRMHPGGKVLPLHPQTGKWWKYGIAASVIIVLGVAGWLYLKPAGKEQVIVQQQDSIATPDTAVMPGGVKATLLLADGRQIMLDEANERKNIQERDVVISSQSGQLVYNNASAEGSVLYNTVTTPKGGQYRVQLPDGSLVWLNAASSLRFPIAFAGSERKVSLTGEAFFEVKPMSNKPFKVAVETPFGDGGEVEVLGTHFNVDAYTDDEVVKTTLLEGSVKIITGVGQNLLKPGQMGTVDKEGGQKLIKHVDTDAVTSWKQGVFAFKGASVPAVMREIARWYNLDTDIQYAGKIPVTSFSGKISRHASIDEIVQVLSINGVQVKIDRAKRKIIVIS